MTTGQIDTSLLVELLKTQTEARPVREGLSRYGWKSTSSYARYEFKRVWMVALALAYRAAQETESIEDALAEIERLRPHSTQVRQLKTAQQAFRSILGLVHKSEPISAAMEQIRAHLRRALERLDKDFGSLVDHEYDGTQCSRARIVPSFSEDGIADVAIPKCRPGKLECRIHEFFNDNLSRFTAIEARILEAAAPSPQLTATREVVNRSLGNPRGLCDNRECRRIGDALIAVDGLPMDEFAANNDSEWTLLSSALGKPYFNPIRRSTPPPIGAAAGRRQAEQRHREEP